jgi:16S rRNA (guanine527-N7)-methyltransferase
MDGVLIVPHGTSWQSELKDSDEALDTIGLQLLENFEYEVSDIKFHALLFKKMRSTPDKYPRATGVPTKKPL